MKHPYFLVFHPKATKELLEAVHWYNERQPDLGDTFFEFVLDAVKKNNSKTIFIRSKIENLQRSFGRKVSLSRHL